MVFKIKSKWFKIISPEFATTQYNQRLIPFLKTEFKKGKAHPKAALIFRALSFKSPEQIRVVIIGQDPYPDATIANGLAFGVDKGVKLPSSLSNIFRELSRDLQTGTVCTNGDLTHWAEQGVLLLNRVLTVRAGEPGSHSGKGWESITDRIVSHLSQSDKPKVFILWGKKAQEVLPLIDTKRNKVVCSSHPSPLSAHNGFFGSRPFTKCNRALKDLGLEPIKWLK